MATRLTRGTLARILQENCKEPWFPADHPPRFSCHYSQGRAVVIYLRVLQWKKEHYQRASQIIQENGFQSWVSYQGHNDEFNGLGWAIEVRAAATKGDG